MALRQWTRSDDKRFEEALVRFPENLPYRFEKIAEHLQIEVGEVMNYYEALLHDIHLIESGRVAVPDYSETGPGISLKSKYSERERKRGNLWTKEEQRLFLEGLEKQGKGDWKTISRDYVRTRTPTQVASHAQKYFLRQNDRKAKKRASIHDITCVDANFPLSQSESITPQPHQTPPAPESSHSHAYST